MFFEEFMGPLRNRSGVAFESLGWSASGKNSSLMKVDRFGNDTFYRKFTWRKTIMPIYEYLCMNCGKIFSIQLSMSEHEVKNLTCPDCKGDEIAQRYSTFLAKTSKKS